MDKDPLLSRVLACLKGSLAPGELSWEEVCSAALKCSNPYRKSDADPYLKCAVLLVRSGADVNHPVQGEKTALMVAGQFCLAKNIYEQISY